MQEDLKLATLRVPGMIDKPHFLSVLVTGSVAFDEIMDFPGRFSDFIKPHKIHQLNVSFVVDRLEKQIGGTGTNIAYNIHLLAPQKAILFASIGHDGDVFLKWMRSQKLSTEGILVDKKLYTATGKAITDKKDNQIWGFYYGASESAKRIKITKYISDGTLSILSANHEDAFMNFQNQLIQEQGAYLYDPGMCLTWIKKKALREGVLNCRYLLGNDYEMSRIFEITGLTKTDLLKRDIAVITTLGENGVHYCDSEDDMSVPAFTIKKVVDPTGAGDAWRGGFVAGLLTGRSTIDCLIMANALASFAVEKYGTVNHQPTKTQVSERMATIKKTLN